MSKRVVVWGTGFVGTMVIAEIVKHPRFELVGVGVSNPAKVGLDVGESCGLGAPLGLTATDDVDALIALKPDALVHYGPTAAHADANIDLITRFLRGYKKGLEYTIKNPEEAVEITSKVAVDGKDPVRVAASMKLRLLCSQNANTRKNGLGWIDVPPLQEGVKIYKDAGFIKNDVDMSKIATNELISKL